MSRAIATLFGVGYLRPAPGTWGSLAALPLAWVLHVLGGFPALVAGTVLAFGLGWWAVASWTRGGEPDPSEAVIDELAGQWLALWPVSYGAAFAGVAMLALWPGWIAAFLLFRLFDIWKPGPIGRADRMASPLGTMLDDLLAGAFAALGVIVLGALWHVVLM